MAKHRIRTMKKEKKENLAPSALLWPREPFRSRTDVFPKTRTRNASVDSPNGREEEIREKPGGGLWEGEGAKEGTQI